MKITQDENKKAMITAMILSGVVVFFVILAIFFFVSSSKIGSNASKKGEQNSEGNGYQITEEEKKRVEELENILRNNLPQIDGITSTIPLEAGISVKLFGKSQEAVEAGIIHTDSERAFSNLLAGRCDVILTNVFTDKQEREAAAKNIALRKETVAYEGIVVAVNVANPVETLTQEQLIGIYSGKIKNWKEVGGNDEEIVAFQNKENDTAQIFMREFMGEEKLIDAQKEFLTTEAGEIVEKTATYDNSENAIGYMVYKYPANVYSEMKFIKIDGIEPTINKMESKEYPLLANIYAIYNTAKESTKTMDELVEWLLTYEGQISVANSGYVPTKTVEVSEKNVDKYYSLGTGKEQAELGNFYYTVNSQDYNVVGQDALVVGIQGLKNQELQDNINSFIRESTEDLQGKENEYEKYLISKPNGMKEGIKVQTECKNGYLSVQVLLKYKVGSHEYIYDGRSKVYDLYSGQELTLSDLYYADVDFTPVLNEQIEKIIIDKTGEDETYIRNKRPFMGITNNILYGLETISFTKENPYFEESIEFKLDTYFENISIINEERDMKDIWEDNIKITKTLVEHEEENTSMKRGSVIKKETSGCVYNVFYMNTEYPETDEKINSSMDNYANDANIKQLLQKAADSGSNLAVNENNKYQITIYTTIIGNKYAIMNVTANSKQERVSLGTIGINLEDAKRVSQDDIQKWKQDNGIN